MEAFKFKNKLELVTQVFTVRMTREEMAILNKTFTKSVVKIKIGKKWHKVLNIYPPTRRQEGNEIDVQIRVEEYNEDHG